MAACARYDAESGFKCPKSVRAQQISCTWVYTNALQDKPNGTRLLLNGQTMHKNGNRGSECAGHQLLLRGAAEEAVNVQREFQLLTAHSDIHAPKSFCASS